MDPWLQAGLSLLIGLLTASGAYLGVRHATRGNDRATQQRDEAARREEWWSRFVWAAQLALDDSRVRRVAGLKLLAKLGRSDLADRDEWLLIDVFQGRVLDELLGDLPDPGEDEGERRSTA
jgi:hypothetical protein